MHCLCHVKFIIALDINYIIFYIIGDFPTKEEFITYSIRRKALVRQKSNTFTALKQSLFEFICVLTEMQLPNNIIVGLLLSNAIK